MNGYPQHYRLHQTDQQHALNYLMKDHRTFQFSELVHSTYLGKHPTFHRVLHFVNTDKPPKFVVLSLKEVYNYFLYQNDAMLQHGHSLYTTRSFLSCFLTTASHNVAGMSTIITDMP